MLFRVSQMWNDIYDCECEHGHVGGLSVQVLSEHGMDDVVVWVCMLSVCLVSDCVVAIHGRGHPGVPTFDCVAQSNV